jgi:hypothetical protein
MIPINSHNFDYKKIARLLFARRQAISDQSPVKRQGKSESVKRRQRPQHSALGSVAPPATSSTPVLVKVKFLHLSFA